ncbi:MAG: helix-turn-helix transcriptional regulator [Ilumatobacter sp.]
MSGPRNAETRLRQLLVMLPWLMEAGEVPLADVAARFELTEAEVTKDLELVAMCGLPPYVDEMIDVFVDDGLVFVGVPRLFTRPLRLTAPEAFGLLTAARAAMELPGFDAEGPLARGLAKLSDALPGAGVSTAMGDDTTGVALDFESPALADDIVEAVEAGRELSIEYLSPARDDAVMRTIVPRHVFTDAGHWYVVADDDLSGERRTFRIDRFVSVAPTGVVHDLDPSAGAPDGFFSDADLPRVTLRLAPRAQWILDRYPIDSVVEVAARTRRSTSSGADVDVVLPVASDRWLDRLLVRLGPNVEVRSPRDRAAGGVELANRILANYR